MYKANRHFQHSSCLSQHGFTLVEIMVAMAIGLFLIAGVYKMFIANRQSYTIQDNMSRLQDNGRFAVNQLSDIIRMAGFKADPADTTTFSTGFATPALTGNDGTGAGGSDKISVSFQAATDGTTVDCLGTAFPSTTPPAMVTNQFYIATDVNGVRNLYCSRLSPTVTSGQPLVEDVANMQISYGVDTNNDGAANFFVAAGNVTDWAQVVGVRLSLLVTTPEDNITSAAQTYQYNGTTVTAGDNRLYQVFTITIALRNRLV